MDGERLVAAQNEGDVLGAHRILVEAYETDVRPIVYHFRETLGLDADPVAAFRAEGHSERLARERGTGRTQSAYEQG